MSQVQQQQQPQQQQQQPPQQSPQSQQQQPQQEYRKSSGPYNQQGEYPGFGGVESNQLIRLAPRPGEKIVRRLGVYVVGAEGVPPREGKIQAVMAEVSCAGKSYTTSAVKDLSPRWNSLYRFSLRNGCVRENILRETSPGTLLISVWIRSFKNKLVGSATVDIGALPLETVVEQTLVLNPNGVSQHQQQHQKQQQPQNGGTNKCTVRVRLHVGTLVYEARGLSAVRIIDPIFDYPYLDKKDEVVPFKPGDIILYNFPGHISAAAKLRTGMQWSHCGIVALLPKKWCGRQSLSIIEFSRNLELFRDMYAEWPLHNGVVIYNLEERLHGVPGTEVWHLPLKAKYFDDVYARNLRNWALEIHDNCKNTVTNHPLNEQKINK